MIWYRRAVYAFSVVFVVLGVALLVVTALPRRRRGRLPHGRPLRRARRRTLPAGAQSVARKVHGLRARPRRSGAVLGRVRRDRLVDLLRARHRRCARARAHAGGAAARRARSSCIVSLSYAEGTAAIPETGGAATFVRRAFNDLWGFVHRLGAVPRLPDRDRAVGAVPPALPRPLHWMRRRCSDSPGTSSSPLRSIAGIVVVRLVRHPRSIAPRSSSRCSISPSSVLVVLGFALLFSPDALTAGLDSPLARAGSDLAFALPLAMLAYTGLETVANLAEETREPGRTCRASLFSAIGLVVIVTVLIAVVGHHGVPGRGRIDRSGRRVAAGAAGRHRRRASTGRCRRRSSTCCGSASASRVR